MTARTCVWGVEILYVLRSGERSQCVNAQLVAAR